MILYLGLCQCGLFNRRPHHRLGALVQSAVHQELHELFGDHPLGVEIHREVGVFPVAGDAQTLELFALDIDPACGEVTAFTAKFVDRHLILVAALLAVLLFDLPLDGQAMAIPTGDIARVKTHHLVGAHDHVLDGFVERVTDVEMAVGIGRAVVQRELLAATVFGFVAQAVIDADLLPTGQPLRLALGQACAHGEIGLGQVQGRFIVKFLRCIGAHVGRPF